MRTAKHDRKQHLQRQASKFHDKSKTAISHTMEVYVHFVANKLVASLTILIYFLYLAFSIYGITKIDINLTTQKLFAADSPLLELDKLRVEYQVPHFPMATIFVNHPGNLSDPDRLQKLNSFVTDMEAINGSWGPIGTQFFVRDYETFQGTFDDDDIDALEAEEEAEDGGNAQALSVKKSLTFNGEDLEHFIKWPEYNYWSGFIRLKNKTHNLEKFFFTTAYHGKEISIWTKRGELLNTWRGTVDKYKTDFEASVFHEDAVFLDLIENMPTDTWQSVLGTLLCMAAVCFLFLNSVFTVVMASASVLSICAGILGILSWWGVDLDPITMAAMIISIGCSVDIPAHVSYHYYQASTRSDPNEDDTPEAKLINCLSSVAFPAVQAGISTILCVCSLLFVKLYMSMVFVKTMVVCVVLCNVHGLIFLPAFLIIFDSVLGHAKTGIRKLKKPKNADNNHHNNREHSNNKNRSRVRPRDADDHNRIGNELKPDRPQLTPDPSPRPTPKVSPQTSPKSQKMEFAAAGDNNHRDEGNGDVATDPNRTQETTMDNNGPKLSTTSRTTKLQPQRAIDEDPPV